jgi:hypothetical protein
MSIGMPTILQGLAMAATLAATGGSAAGQALDRFGSRSRPPSDVLAGVATADPAVVTPVDSAAGAGFYALHRDYGLTPDPQPARPLPGERLPAAELAGQLAPDPGPPAAAPVTPVKPASSPSDF